MIHARSDYDAIQPWPTKRPHLVKVDGVTRNHDEIEDWEAPSSVDPIIPDNEPVLLIRGQDLAAIPTGEAWCVEAERLGVDPRMVACVRRQIELIREWQKTHAKVPDGCCGDIRKSQ